MKLSIFYKSFMMLLLFLLLTGSGFSQSMSSQDQRMQWWREARFGLFIHWGLYAIPAGVWNGKEVPNIGEHIMRMAKIPAVEYRKLAAQFNPDKFNAHDYVALAKRTGMKYIAITAKHHDGFAMFKSEASAYNVVDATPFKRDVVKELADECHKQGLKFCFYYSQSRDWNEPDGLHNTWDFKEPRNFQKYLDQKVKPQLTELLTKYGPVGMIWFDTPEDISAKQAEELKHLVRKLQPNCIISGRLGGGIATDYSSTEDNVVPSFSLPGDWETPATLNNTWGFKTNDHNWKTSGNLIRLLFDICSKGGNYLLNIGPKADGEIPKESIAILNKIGDWMKINHEAIWSTTSSPYKAEFDWGNITSKTGQLYLGVYKWKPGTFYLEGLKNKVKKVYLLADPAKHSLFYQELYDAKLNHKRLRIDLPKSAPDSAVSVVVVEIDGLARVESRIVQQQNGNILLPGILASAAKGTKKIQLNYTTPGGGAGDYKDPGVLLTWDFKVEKPGRYEVNVVTTEAGSHQKPIWQGGQSLKITCDGQELLLKIQADVKEYNVRTQYWKKIYTKGSSLVFKSAGLYRLSLVPVDLSTGAFTFREIKLIPAINN